MWRVVVANRFDPSVRSEDALQGRSVLKQVTGKKLFFFHFLNNQSYVLLQ